MKKLDFIIIGAQKSGTSALSHFLAQHPEICMAEPREAHAFDHEGYAGKWCDELLDEYYGGYFRHASGEPCLGEATPIYLFLPAAAAEISTWNPDIKLLVILRDPVERAISHYRMAVEEGYEHLPLWLALLVEPLRLWLGSARLAEHSMYRENSYRGRGLYARQLLRFRKHFKAGQILVLHSEALRAEHADTLVEVFDFLGVANDIDILPEQINTREQGPAYSLCKLFLRLSYWYDLWRLSRLVAWDMRAWMLRR